MLYDMIKHTLLLIDDKGEDDEPGIPHIRPRSPRYRTVYSSEHLHDIWRVRTISSQGETEEENKSPESFALVVTSFSDPKGVGCRSTVVGSCFSHHTFSCYRNLTPNAD